MTNTNMTQNTKKTIFVYNDEEMFQGNGNVEDLQVSISQSRSTPYTKRIQELIDNDQLVLMPGATEFSTMTMLRTRASKYHQAVIGHNQGRSTKTFHLDDGTLEGVLLSDDTYYQVYVEMDVNNPQSAQLWSESMNERRTRTHYTGPQGEELGYKFLMAVYPMYAQGMVSDNA